MSCCNEELSVVAGDDLTLNVVFDVNGEPVQFSDNDKVSLIIHKNDGEVCVEPEEIKDSTAVYYLSPELTRSLLKNGLGTTCRYCIQVEWGDGGQSTPIYREKLIVRRC